MEEFGTAGQATDDNTAHAHFTLDTLDYKHSQDILHGYTVHQ